MGRVFRRFLTDLINGDPVALICAGAIVAIALALCLVWWMTARKLRREDEERKNRYKSKKKNQSNKVPFRTESLYVETVEADIARGFSRKEKVRKRCQEPFRTLKGS
jgi:hypothetical protein